MIRQHRPSRYDAATRHLIAVAEGLERELGSLVEIEAGVITYHDLPALRATSVPAQGWLLTFFIGFRVHWRITIAVSGPKFLTAGYDQIQDYRPAPVAQTTGQHSVALDREVEDVADRIRQMHADAVRSLIVERNFDRWSARYRRTDAPQPVDRSLILWEREGLCLGALPLLAAAGYRPELVTGREADYEISLAIPGAQRPSRLVLAPVGDVWQAILEAQQGEAWEEVGSIPSGALTDTGAHRFGVPRPPRTDLVERVDECMQMALLQIETGAGPFRLYGFDHSMAQAFQIYWSEHAIEFGSLDRAAAEELFMLGFEQSRHDYRSLGCPKNWKETLDRAFLSYESAATYRVSRPAFERLYPAAAEAERRRRDTAEPPTTR